MAIKVGLQFQVVIDGDGVSTTAAVDLASAPICYQPNSGSLSPLFNITATLPSDIHNLQCTDGATVTFTRLLSVVTFTLSPAPAANSFPVISGIFKF